MNLDFVPSYRVFYDESQATALANSINEHGISAWLVEDSTVVDENFIGAAAQPMYRVKVRQEDFERVNEFLLQMAESGFTSIPDEHYLLQFTTPELKDILARPHEWSANDLVLARMILKTRVDEVAASIGGNDQLSIQVDPFAPKKWTTRELIMVYVSLTLFGMAGIVLGLMMWRSTKTLPDGNIIYSNSEEDRRHGKTIILIGLAIFALAFYGALRMEV